MSKKNSKTKKNIFHNEKALVMGLGLHGGGVATTKWLVHHGAKVTATDMRDSITLATSVAALKGLPVRFVLGKHDMSDFMKSDIVIVNPGVPRESEYLRAAEGAGARIENDASLFFRYLENPVVAVTGTRGKTTSTLWIAALLSKKYKSVRPSGNTSENAFLKEFERVKGKRIPVVAEMSSWQLELLPVSKKAPHIAVITNLYPDHLNRYRGIQAYAKAKANIFRHQQADDFLILNHHNEWTPFFLRQKPKSTVFYFTRGKLKGAENGIYMEGGAAYFRFDGLTQRLFPVERFVNEHGTHNLENLLAVVLAVKLYDPGISVSERDILSLPLPRMREEIIVNTKKLLVVNDSCATSPDGTIAALRRFGAQGDVILIAGGTDKSLEFKTLSSEIKKLVQKGELVLLEGSATTKLLTFLPAAFTHDPPLKTLAECVARAFRIASVHKRRTIILFSPAAASFEKFLHEFDRGERFNLLIKKIMKKTVR